MQKKLLSKNRAKKNATQRKKCQNIVRGRGRLSYLVAKMSSGRHILAGKKRTGFGRRRTPFRCCSFFPRDSKCAKGWGKNKKKKEEQGNASLGRAFFGWFPLFVSRGCSYTKKKITIIHVNVLKDILVAELSLPKKDKSVSMLFSQCNCFGVCCWQL